MFYLCIRLITKHMDEITKIETVDQYDQLFGLETLHPLVNVIDFSKATKSVEYIRMNIGFYCLFLKDAKCGDLTYGRDRKSTRLNSSHPSSSRMPSSA